MFTDGFSYQLRMRLVALMDLLPVYPHHRGMTALHLFIRSRPFLLSKGKEDGGRVGEGDTKENQG